MDNELSRGAAPLERRIVPVRLRSLAACLALVALGEISLGATKSAETAAGRDPGVDQLRIGEVFESAGRFADAEAAYGKAIATGGEAARKAAITALERVIRLRAETADVHLKLGDTFAREGRFADAEAAYAKVLDGGTSAMRVEALQRLTTIILQRRGAGSDTQTKLARLYEREDRLADAEAAYIRALDGPEAKRDDTFKQVTKMVEKREGVLEKHVLPRLKAALPTFVLVAILLLVRQMLRAYARRRQKRSLEISGFGPTQGPRATGSAFGETLAAVHERMVSYFEPRSTGVGSGKMPNLVRAEAPALVELVSIVSSSTAPLAAWFRSTLRQPGYRIVGSSETTWRQIKVRAKLEYEGKTVAQWSNIYPVSGWFVAEQELAFEILMRLKEHSDARSS